MAHGAEDCASVLEQFVHDVANLPAEINHLMEEIQAKDKVIQEYRTTINTRDGSMQKFIKLNGSLAPNPKEEQYGKMVLQNFDKSQQLQDDKIQLSEKACVLLDRQIKKLDIKIRDLQNDGVLSNDPPIPSLFNSNKDQYRDPPKIFFPDSTTTDNTSYSSALNPTSGNANAVLGATQRLSQSFARPGGIAALSSQSGARSSAPATPAAGIAPFQQRHQRESSAGAIDSKRRRLNASLGTLPAASSNLRQSSLGPGTLKPGTPKPGTPGPGRTDSAGPRTAGVTRKALTKKVAPHQQLKKLKAHFSKTSKRSSSTGARIRLGMPKKSPNEDDEDDEDDSMLSSADMSDSENASESRELDDDDEDEGNEDTKVYCTCRSVSHGDMVACDNDNCPYEWFHWKCVGLTREPVGTWFCDECRATLGK